MVEAGEVSADGLTWTFRLRTGLTFHDGEPVLAKDAVASINRWAAREAMGGMIKAIENEITAVDDRTFRWSLKRPYPKMLLALGKLGAPCCFVMPARIAATDPFRQINEYVGSGPMRFIRSEWVSGAKAAFEKFNGYVPRQEPASWLAGGKNVVVDRIEWITIVANGFASSAQVEAEVAAWFDAKSADEEKTIARRLNKAALDHVLYAPLGLCLIHNARRKNVSGMIQAPVPLFWGVRKTA